MRRILPLFLGVAVVAACGDMDTDQPLAPGGVDAASHDAGFGRAAAATYEVTIENLTAEGQPLTPPLAVTHREPVSLFTPGEPASTELKEIAENGNLSLMLGLLADELHVADFTVAAGDPPPLFPEGSITFELTTERGAMFLSFVSMLICTNDGFTGVSGLRLPVRQGVTGHAYAGAYDAGTEINTEDFADMVPPCQSLVGVTSDDEGTGMSDPELYEGGVVRHHPGIQGGEDLLPEVHGWMDPVTRIVVERTS